MTDGTAGVGVAASLLDGVSSRKEKTGTAKRSHPFGCVEESFTDRILADLHVYASGRCLNVDGLRELSMRRASVNGAASRSVNGEKPLYVSPKELVRRWQCSRTQVDRIARREGLTRMLFGSGRNGMVRYVRAEVEAFETRSTA